MLYLRRHGLCVCGAKLASKAHCLDCLVRNREAARRRAKAHRRRECLSRRLERERHALSTMTCSHCLSAKMHYVGDGVVCDRCGFRFPRI